MHCTLREYLRLPNTTLRLAEDSTLSRARGDKASLDWHPIYKWRAWIDFTYESIDDLLGKVLDLEFELPDPPKPVKAACSVRTERRLEHILSQRNCVIVNEALEKSCAYLRIGSVFWLPDPSWPKRQDGIRVFPDWHGEGEVNGEPKNLVPGDTKLVRSPISKEDERSFFEQANYYAALDGTRYAYIISNEGIVLLRRTLCNIVSTPIALSRARRGGQQPRDATPTPRPLGQRTSSPLLLPQSQPQPESDDYPSSPPPYQPSSSSFRDDQADQETQDIELIRVPWSAQEPGELTVNLAIFAIHLLDLVANGMQDAYPRINQDSVYRKAFNSNDPELPASN